MYNLNQSVNQSAKIETHLYTAYKSEACIVSDTKPSVWVHC